MQNCVFNILFLKILLRARVIWKLILRQMYFTKSVDAHCANIISVLQSFKTWTLSFKVFSQRVKKISLSLFRCCAHFREKNEKLCVMEKSVYDSEWITFVSLTSVSRFALNKIFSLAEISQRKEDPFLRKLTSCTNFYVIPPITELFLLWISSNLLWCLGVFSLK